MALKTNTLILSILIFLCPIILVSQKIPPQLRWSVMSGFSINPAPYDDGIYLYEVFSIKSRKTVFEVPLLLDLTLKHKRYGCSIGMMWTYKQTEFRYDTAELNLILAHSFPRRSTIQGIDYSLGETRFSFPIAAYYYVIQRKQWQVFAQLGIAPNFSFYFNEKGWYKNYDAREKRLTDDPPFYASNNFTETRFFNPDIMPGIGIDYFLKNAAGLRLLIQYKEYWRVFAGLSVAISK
jgi:hypothetical protein